MVRKIDDIEWFDLNPSLLERNLILLENFPFKLPAKFIELLLISDGGSVDYEFTYFDPGLQKIMYGSIGQIYGIATESTKIINKYYNPFSSKYNQQEYFILYNDIINNYNDPPEFFPKDLVIFGQNGAGNMICFDYRTDSKTDNPPIVYWRHDADIGKDVSFVANNFEEFIKMLEAPDDEEFEKLYNQSKKNS